MCSAGMPNLLYVTNHHENESPHPKTNNYTMNTPQPDKRPLKIYRASAGSGKTFTLAVEYIKLLVANPLAYKNILAVTFTNKATGEMKNRILSQLYGLSKGLGSSNDYLSKIKADPAYKQYDDATIRQRCNMALQSIVHDYSRFRIETIDSFFQSVLRDLAHELKLSANLRVDLNDKEVLKKAVEDIIYNLAPNSPLFNWIFSFVQQKIEEEKNWIVKDSIASFGENIFNETFLENREKLEQTLSDSHALSNYRTKMNDIIKSAGTTMKECGMKFLELCEQHNLEMNDFAGKSKGMYPYMKAISEGKKKDWSSTAQDTLDGSKEWIKGGDTMLCDQFTQLLATYYQQFYLKNSAEASVQHISNLGLLNDIDNTVRQLNNEANRFLLSDTSHFLNEMIGESDVPFLYEKIGNKFSHIMIDEFQDTSRLQWLNFLPLLCNALATNSTCLIVGDVKQSIYRWRNSDWSILNNIDSTPEIRNKIDSITLDTNFRSGERIINFNNLFFTKLIEILNKNYEQNHNGSAFSDLKSAYKDIHQHFNDKHKGMGYVRFQKVNQSEYEEQTLQSLLDTVHELKEKGVRDNQMAIILRANRHIPVICKYFAEHDSSIKMISDEAFQLKSSPAVKIIILALRTLVNPRDTLSKKSLTAYYQQIDTNEINSSIYTASDEEIDRLLPSDFVKNMRDLSMMSLTEVTERIHHLFQLDRIPGQSAYLFCLFDKIVEYMRDNPSDINSFLAAWDEGMCDKTIPNDAVEGIRLISIHKSKGLEFHTVLMPFCDWQFKGEDIMWVTPESKDCPDFEDLELLPINNNQQLIHSIYLHDYDQELLRAWVDNANLLYVGFTRAENNLFIWTQGKEEKNTSNKSGKEGVSTISVLANCMTAGLPDQKASEGMIEVKLQDENGNLKVEKIVDVASLFTTNDQSGYMEYGEIVTNQPSTHTQEPQQSEEQPQIKKEEKEENILKFHPQPIKCQFHYHEHKASFLQSNESKRFIAGKDEEEPNQYINEGLLFHAILERITSPADLPRIIAQFDSEGWFHSEEYRQSVAYELEKAFRNTQASDWFDSRWQTFNECSILYTDENGKCKTKRPDRVITDGNQTIVIDYKTGRQNEDHVNQVTEYMERLQEMNYPNISGYVWYIRRNDIVPCRKE